MKIKIITGSKEIEIAAEPGARLDDLILSAGLLFNRPCGGEGRCGKCRVTARGRLSPRTALEAEHLSASELERGLRLACQARVTGEAELLLEAGLVVTDKNFRDDEDLGRYSGPLGLAVDLGTTTVAAFLVGLENGRVFCGSASQNRQSGFGAEVMSRLTAADQDSSSLRDLAWQSVCEAASGLALDAEMRGRVKSAVVVGNSAMHHLALGLPVGSLLRSPFEPHDRAARETALTPLQDLFPELSRLCFAPLIGGFVGSDALACLIYFALDRGRENALAVDLGTNGEVMLCAGERLWAASAAAGPAFEAVNISCGMRAAPGAVTSLAWDDEKGLTVETVDDAPPRGLCGSGLLSAVHLLVRRGVIEHSGLISQNPPRSAIIIESGQPRRVKLAPGVWLNQLDVRELQKAKAAVRAAIEILLERAGIGPSQLSRVILTGSFGGRLKPEQVLGLGVLPRVPPSKIHGIPNGAGMGAAMMLKPEIFERAAMVAGRVEHVELNFHPGFMDRFVEAMTLGADIT